MFYAKQLTSMGQSSVNRTNTVQGLPCQGPGLGGEEERVGLERQGEDEQCTCATHICCLGDSIPLPSHSPKEGRDRISQL